MEAPAKGAVVLVRFPFSDLSRAKLPPAVVLADAGRGDYVLLPSHQQAVWRRYSSGARPDCVRVGLIACDQLRETGKLFTASGDLITAEVGALTREAQTNEDRDTVIAL